ncbi:hypothetical protein [Helicobacter equorum]|uniref:hypothetical protein n=1 Tax=Helicobacter equorum TaxID=361872 RepID=UPI00131576BD|nr:hypothetical protein [Helicobacter equorum]
MDEITTIFIACEDCGADNFVEIYEALEIGENVLDYECPFCNKQSEIYVNVSFG